MGLLRAVTPEMLSFRGKQSLKRRYATDLDVTPFAIGSTTARVAITQRSQSGGHRCGCCSCKRHIS